MSQSGISRTELGILTDSLRQDGSPLCVHAAKTIEGLMDELERLRNRTPLRRGRDVMSAPDTAESVEAMALRMPVTEDPAAAMLRRYAALLAAPPSPDVAPMERLPDLSRGHGLWRRKEPCGEGAYSYWTDDIGGGRMVWNDCLDDEATLREVLERRAQYGLW